MRTLTSDARSFVHGVVEYLRKEGKAPTALPRVKTLFRKVTTDAKRQNQARVESAVSLTLAERQTLSRILATLVGHSLSIRFTTRKELTAGFRIRVADWIVDTSFTGQLESLAASLIRV